MNDVLLLRADLLRHFESAPLNVAEVLKSAAPPPLSSHDSVMRLSTEEFFAPARWRAVAHVQPR